MSGPPDQSMDLDQQNQNETQESSTVMAAGAEQDASNQADMTTPVASEQQPSFEFDLSAIVEWNAAHPSGLSAVTEWNAAHPFGLSAVPEYNASHPFGTTMPIAASEQHPTQEMNTNMEAASGQNESHQADMTMTVASEQHETQQTGTNLNAASDHNQSHQADEAVAVASEGAPAQEQPSQSVTESTEIKAAQINKDESVQTPETPAKAGSEDPETPSQPRKFATTRKARKPASPFWPQKKPLSPFPNLEPERYLIEKPSLPDFNELKSHPNKFDLYDNEILKWREAYDRALNLKDRVEARCNQWQEENRSLRTALVGKDLLQQRCNELGAQKQRLLEDLMTAATLLRNNHIQHTFITEAREYINRGQQDKSQIELVQDELHASRLDKRDLQLKVQKFQLEIIELKSTEAGLSKNLKNLQSDLRTERAIYHLERGNYLQDRENTEAEIKKEVEIAQKKFEDKILSNHAEEIKNLKEAHEAERARYAKNDDLAMKSLGDDFEYTDPGLVQDREESIRKIKAELSNSQNYANQLQREVSSQNEMITELRSELSKAEVIVNEYSEKAGGLDRDIQLLKNSMYEEVENEVNRREAAFKNSILGEIQERTAKMNELEKTLEKQNKLGEDLEIVIQNSATQNQRIVKEFSERIRKQDSELAEKDKDIETKKKAISNKDKDIANKDKTISSKDKAITNKDKVIASKDKDIEAKDKELTEKLEELQKIKTEQTNHQQELSAERSKTEETEKRLEEYRNNNSELQSKLKTAQNRGKDHGRKMDDAIQKLKDKALELENDKSQKDDSIKHLEEELERSQKLVAENETRIAANVKHVNETKEKDKQINKLETEIETLNSARKSDMEKSIKLKHEINYLKNTSDSKDKKYQRETEMLGEANQKAKDFEKKYESEKRIKSDLNEKNQQLQQEYDTLSVEHNAILRYQEENEGTLNESIDNLRAEVGELGKDKNEQQALIDELNKANKQLAEENERLIEEQNTARTASTAAVSPTNASLESELAAIGASSKMEEEMPEAGELEDDEPEVVPLSPPPPSVAPAASVASSSDRRPLSGIFIIIMTIALLFLAIALSEPISAWLNPYPTTRGPAVFFARMEAERRRIVETRATMMVLENGGSWPRAMRAW